jgi:hypothetical protein
MLKNGSKVFILFNEDDAPRVQGRFFVRPCDSTRTGPELKYQPWNITIDLIGYRSRKGAAGWPGRCYGKGPRDEPSEKKNVCLNGSPAIRRDLPSH